MLTYTLKVEQIVKETVDTVTICFKQPALKKIKYEAGQYLTLIFRINGRRYIRPYSFSSAPGVDKTLNITVKRVQGGIVSNHILDKINTSDVIEVLHPMGDFTLSKVRGNIDRKHIVLWGSGSGITPLISIAKAALNEMGYEHITLVYGNRSFESTIFSDQIADLKNRYPEHFSVWHFHTRTVVENDHPYVIQGRIDPEKVLNIMENEGELDNTIHFICGPKGLKESVRLQLAKLKIPNENIFYEEFEVTRDPKVFEGMLTRNVAFKLEDRNLISVEVAKGKSILEAGLDAMIDLTYSCQTGSCLLCKAVVLSGNVKTIGIERLPEELNDNECLMCCGFPLTDDVEILITN